MAYIENKNNPNNIVYIDESLKPILKETYGVILYQEQIIAILELMGGLTKSEAQISDWQKTIAPSEKLRKWYAHDVAKWADFKLLYFAELSKKA